MRIEANLKLLELLKETLCKNPELRFIQALWNLGIIDRAKEEWGKSSYIRDRFYEESEDTLKRISE